MSLTISPKESTILKFKIDVSGSARVPIPRLIIPINERGVHLVFEGIMNNGQVEVDVQELLELTNSKEFSGKLEVIIEDQIFVPWEETIIIEESLEVKAKTVKAKKTKKKIIVEAAESKTESKTELNEELKVMKLKSAKDLFKKELDN